MLSQHTQEIRKQCILCPQYFKQCLPIFIKSPDSIQVTRLIEILARMKYIMRKNKLGACFIIDRKKNFQRRTKTALKKDSASLVSYLWLLIGNCCRAKRDSKTFQVKMSLLKALWTTNGPQNGNNMTQKMVAVESPQV